MMHFPLVRALKLGGKHYTSDLTCNLPLCRLALIKYYRCFTATNERYNNEHSAICINYAILIKPSTLESDFLHYMRLCCFQHAL